ncbi:hypothetical protein ELQ87_20690 [Streptomyces griseoviridis]|uniref:Serine/threonine protein kinase n=1 Tax=Streptomyces griseoviridis TaxID=45398 RepID=A0A3S9ZFL2_STRGD|nr:hypothetical protein [Streptomyces griseoviridis]AZS86407.1 hypothetical protein ELQ87_20690 [Streptomyces griseoviridis]QCN86729.1 hypothetical protein DDJ31_18585 [Streptomyces griseoviridis]
MATPEPAAPPTPEERPAPRRSRTAPLIACAAVLGVVAGTCVGYLVQADRAPTRLPSLAQPVLAQAKGPGPEPLSAARDRQVRTDGDLRKLLVEKPAGARKSDLSGVDGWVDLAEYSTFFVDLDSSFRSLMSEGFRRAVVAEWAQGDRQTGVVLAQYRQENVLEVDGYEWSDLYADIDGVAREGWPVPGTGSGLAYADPEPIREFGYGPLYTATAFAHRGDIVMKIWITDTKRIPKATITDLAERQLERL